MKPYFRNVGVACTALFSLIGLASVLMAYFNIDGSFPRPLLAAACFGLFWSCFILLGVWLLLLYRRYRLFIAEDSLRQCGVATDRSVTLSQVQELKWRRFPTGGSVRVLAADGSLKIDLGNFVQPHRDELISFFRRSIPVDRQLGWTEFQRQFQDNPERRTQSRRASLVASLILGFHAIAFLVLWGIGLGNQYLAIAIINTLFLIYYQRGSRIRPSPSEDGQPSDAPESPSRAF